MANPQPTDAHLRVAHSINEAIMLRDFKKRQRKILDLILRLSWGCGKKTAYIPRQRDFEVIGIRETHISTELSWLMESKVITINDAEYAFNKDFDQWQVSRVSPYTPKKLTELVRLNLNNNRQLTKTVSKNLPKEEVSTYQKSKFVTPELASPKENIKENINKDITDKDLENTLYLGQSLTKILRILRKESKEYEGVSKQKLRLYRQELKRLGIEV